MSGGSFDYVSITDIDIVGPSEHHLAIVAALSEYPSSERATELARAALAKWQQAVALMREADAEWHHLRPVLRAVEWDHSGDCTEKDVARELEALNAQQRDDA